VEDLSRLSEDSRRAVEEMLRGGRKIAAIKRVRRELDLDLRDAKEAVEAHMSALGIEHRSSSGCLLVILALGTGLLLGIAAG